MIWLQPEGLALQLPEDSSARSQPRFEFLQLRRRAYHVDLDVAGPDHLQWLLHHLLDVRPVLQGRLRILSIIIKDDLTVMSVTL